MPDYKTMPITDLEAIGTAEAYDAFWLRIEDGFFTAREDMYDLLLQRIRVHLDDWPGQQRRILDVGCAKGYALAYLASRIESAHELALYGVDFSQVAIEAARNRLPDATLTAAAWLDYDLPRAKMHISYCMQTLEHFNDPLTSVNKMADATRKNGLVVLTIPNGQYDDYKAHRHFWRLADFRRFLEQVDGAALEHLGLFRNDRNIIAVLRKG